MPSIDDIAAEYVERAAELDPCYATYAGIAGHDHELADLSADGFAGRAGLDRSTLAALDVAEAPDRREQVARAAMAERLALAVECYDAGDTTSELSTIASWVQKVREVFDLMPTDGEEALDIGVHLELDVPRGTGWREGERWNAEISWEFLRAHSSWDERQLRSELRRCLGLPGQAPSYKIGERIWLQAREGAMARAGAAFSLKDFHARALSLGAMGLDPLREALARI